MSDIAVAHWAADCDGGGERVAWELGRALHAPVYLGTRNHDIEPDDVDARSMFDSKWLARVRRTPLRMFGDMLAWERASALREYDTIVTSANPYLRYVREDDQAWLAYVHHTRRRETDRFGSAMTDGVSGLLSQVMALGQRVLYQQAVEGPDLYVANSELVKQRMQWHWGLDADDIRVVNPPVDIDALGPDVAGTKEMYLYLGRLVPNKRVVDLVKRWSSDLPNRQLVVAGDGPQLDAVEAAAGDNVTVLGYVPEKRKRELLSEARAFVFGAESEDFGIAPVEALASGTPVLGVAEGMTQYQVRDGVNGWTWTRPDERGRGLTGAVERLESQGVEWSPDQIAEWAEQFGIERFRSEIRDSVSEARRRSQLEVDYFGKQTEVESAETITTDGGEEHD